MVYDSEPTVEDEESDLSDSGESNADTDAEESAGEEGDDAA